MFTRRFNFIRIAGIQIGIDLSWLFIAVLLTWTLATGYFPLTYPGLSVGTYWGMGFLGMMGLFVCIVLHELGHAFMAKHFKLPISQITLFLFGGVAEIRKESSSPKVEFWVAIAGPLVTLALMLSFYILHILGASLAWPMVLQGIISYLAGINTWILLFNLVPAFPLDVGRVLRAILWACTKNVNKATRVATHFGTAFGIFLIFFGIFLFIGGSFVAGIWLVILGLFLQKAALSSQTQFFISQELRHAKVVQFMKNQIETVSPTLTIQEFIQTHLYRSHHHLYPVVEGEKLLGAISLKEVKSAPPQEWPSRTLQSILLPLSQCLILSPHASALDAMNQFQETDVSTLLIVEGEHLLGILTAQDLFKFLSIKIELEDSARR